jgi:kumamolisin
MRAAYYGAGPLTGAGQSIGLLEFVGYDPFDPQNYFDLYGPPLTATITPVQCDNSQAVCTTCEDAEQALDIEQAISMAPGIDECLVYVGQTDAVMLNRMASDNVAKSIGCSWSWRPADPATDDPIFLEFAAQGQTFFTAAGDSGAWNAGTLFSWPG